MFNSFLISGIILVNAALILYTLGFIFVMKSKSISLKIRLFFLAGVFFDILSTALMIIGSRKLYLTFHSVLGYCAIILMLIELIILWVFSRKGDDIKNL